LWPWYFGAIEALWLMLMALILVFLIKSKSVCWSRLGWAVFLILFFKNLSFLNPLPIRKEIRDDPANLRVRSAVIDKIYRESASKGMSVYTFAPYVYDYPYQYLIWWQAKTKYGYRPEKYYYLDNQPAYVPAKEKADTLVPSRKAEATYLIIEPYESQREWYDQWRSNFGQACQDWEIGRTRLEKLCE
jgi:hypothetical protein